MTKVSVMYANGEGKHFDMEYYLDKHMPLVGKLLGEKKWTLSTAESCTGGYIAHLITSVSGSSVYFEGSIVSYSNDVKETQLGVSWESLKNEEPYQCLQKFRT